MPSLFTTYITLLIVCFCVVACNSSNATQNSLPNKFFNLTHFFTQQDSLLKKEGKSLHKKMQLNGQQEQQTLKANVINWATELALFKDADINRVAWRDSYTINRQQINGDSVITYKADKTDLRTQNIILAFKPNQTAPHTITVNRKLNNLLYSMNETYTYRANVGYSINTTQQIIGMEPDNFVVEASFINK